MEAEEVIELFDSIWFEMDIFKKDSRSSRFESNPESKVQEEATKPELYRLPTIITRTMSDQSCIKTSFSSDYSLSPDSVLHTPKLQTILSGKEIVEEEEEEENSFLRRVLVQESPERKTTNRQRRGKKSMSKSLSELEFEELKGFMDLGFVFSEEDKDSSLASLLPGLQRLGKKDGEEEEKRADESAVSRPYLSEAWEVLERRKKEDPLMNWKIPALSNEIDMKDSLRWWAQTVASTVR